MGYWTCLYLVNVIVEPTLRTQIDRTLREPKKIKDQGLRDFLPWVGISSDGTLQFRPDSEDDSLWPECPGDEGFVGSMNGMWYAAERIAEWLCRNCSSGQLILHSLEGDAEAFGWEFRNGRIRHLELQPATHWEVLRPAVRPKARRQKKRA